MAKITYLPGTEPPKKRRPGRPSWQPTERDRHAIKSALAAGLTQEQVAGMVGTSLATLKLRCPKELKAGANAVNAKVANKLFQKCMKGDTIALIFWCKTRLGWRETHRTEHTGADGGPIQHEKIEADANAFTDRIEALARKLDLVSNTANDRQPAPPTEGEEQCSLSS